MFTSVMPDSSTGPSAPRGRATLTLATGGQDTFAAQLAHLQSQQTVPSRRDPLNALSTRGQRHATYTAANGLGGNKGSTELADLVFRSDLPSIAPPKPAPAPPSAEFSPTRSSLRKTMNAIPINLSLAASVSPASPTNASPASPHAPTAPKKQERVASPRKVANLIAAAKAFGASTRNVLKVSPSVSNSLTRAPSKTSPSPPNPISPSPSTQSQLLHSPSSSVLLPQHRQLLRMLRRLPNSTSLDATTACALEMLGEYGFEHCTVFYLERSKATANSAASFGSPPQSFSSTTAEARCRVFCVSTESRPSEGDCLFKHRSRTIGVPLQPPPSNESEQCLPSVVQYVLLSGEKHYVGSMAIAERSGTVAKFDPDMDNPCSLNIRTLLCLPLLLPSASTPTESTTNASKMPLALTCGALAVSHKFDQSPVTDTEQNLLSQVASFLASRYTHNRDRPPSGQKSCSSGSGAARIEWKSSEAMHASVKQLASSANSAADLAGTVVSLTQDLQQLTSTKDILTRTGQAVKELVASEVISLFSVSHASQEVVCEVSPLATRGSRFPMSGCLAGQVALRQQALTVEDVRLTDGFDPRIDQVGGATGTSVATACCCVPLCDENKQVIAVLQCLKTQRINQKTKTILPAAAGKMLRDLLSDVGSSISRNYTSADQQVILQVARIAAIALSRAVLLSRLTANESRSLALLEIVKCASSDEDVEAIIPQIIEKTYRIISVDRVTLFIVDSITNELWCKVSQDAKGFRIPMSKGVAGHVATTGEILNIPDAYQSPYFSREMDQKTGFRTRNILCMPVKDKHDTVVAVTQVINKRPFGEPFTREDEEIMSAVNHEIANMLKRKSLDTMFAGIVNGDETSTRSFIEQYVKKNVKGDDEEEMEQGFEAQEIIPGDSDDDSESEERAESRERLKREVEDAIKPRPSITGPSDQSPSTASSHVATTAPGTQAPEGTTKAPADSQAKASVTIPPAGTEAQPKPVVDTAQQGAAQPPASPAASSPSAPKKDSPIAAPSHSRKQSLPDRATSQVKARGGGSAGGSRPHSSTEEHKDVMTPGPGLPRRNVSIAMFAMQGRSLKKLEPISTWKFNPLDMPHDELLPMAFEMFECFNLLSVFRIDAQKLRNFLTAICGGYRDNPYHNFYHGFSTLHCAFMILRNSGMIPNLSSHGEDSHPPSALPRISSARGLSVEPQLAVAAHGHGKFNSPAKFLHLIDILALFIACISHDVDHRGYNNSFHIESDDPLAILYNDQSVLENHHASTTFKILYEPQNNFLSHLPRDQMKKIRTTVLKGILSTDISEHAALIGMIQKVTTERSFTANNPDDRMLIVKTLVHSADLSNPILPTEVAAQWADRVSLEFKKQFDSEKSKGLPVTSFMDIKTEHDKARLNLNFINYVAAPLWVLVANEIFPTVKENLRYMEENKAHWQRIISAHEEATKKAEAAAAAATNPPTQSPVAATTVSPPSSSPSAKQSEESSPASPPAPPTVTVTTPSRVTVNERPISPPPQLPSAEKPTPSTVNQPLVPRAVSPAPNTPAPAPVPALTPTRPAAATAIAPAVTNIQPASSGVPSSSTGSPGNPVGGQTTMSPGSPSLSQPHSLPPVSPKANSLPPLSQRPSLLESDSELQKKFIRPSLLAVIGSSGGRDSVGSPKGEELTPAAKTVSSPISPVTAASILSSSDMPSTSPSFNHTSSTISNGELLLSVKSNITISSGARSSWESSASSSARGLSFDRQDSSTSSFSAGTTGRPVPFQTLESMPE